MIDPVDPNKKAAPLPRPTFSFVRTLPKFKAGDLVRLERNLFNTADEVRVPKGLIVTVIGDQGGYPHTVGIRIEGFSLGEPIDADSLTLVLP
jgi:hypothetical protein